MHREQLLVRASRAAARQESLRFLRRSPSLLDFLQYLLIRNTLPIASMLLKRCMMLIEIALIVYIFGNHQAASIASILFAFWLFRGVFDGISQHYRVEIALAAQQHQRESLQSLSQHCNQLAWIYGACCGVIAWIFFSCFSTSLIFKALLLSWTLTFPLELSAQTLWSVLYTQGRARRSLIYQIVSLLLPSLMLLLLYPWCGLLAYPIGVLGARCLAYGNLHYVARRQLIRDDLLPPKTFTLTISVRDLIRSFAEIGVSHYFYFVLPFVMYQVAVGCMLGWNSRELWITHFFFAHITAMVFYPALRVPLSMKADLYFLLREGNLRLARQLQRHLLKALGIVAAMTAILVVGLPSFHAALFSGHPALAVKLFPYVLIAAFARGFWECGVIVTQTAALEPRSTRIVGAIICLVLLPLQFIFINEWRANLQAVYLLDSVFFIVLGAIVLVRNDLAASPLLAATIANDSRTYSTIERWTVEVGKQASRKKLQLAFLALDERYASRGRSEALLERINQECDYQATFVAISSRFFLAAFPRSVATTPETIQRKFSPHLRVAVGLHSADSIAETLQRINAALRARGLHGGILESTEVALREKELSAIVKQVALEVHSKLVGAVIIEALQALKLNVDSVVKFNGSQWQQSNGAISVEAKTTALHAFYTMLNHGTLPFRRGSFLVMPLPQEELLLFDLREIPAARRSTFLPIVVALQAVVFAEYGRSIVHSTSTTSVVELPAELPALSWFEMIRSGYKVKRLSKKIATVNKASTVSQAELRQ